MYNMNKVRILLNKALRELDKAPIPHTFRVHQDDQLVTGVYVDVKTGSLFRVWAYFSPFLLSPCVSIDLLSEKPHSSRDSSYAVNYILSHINE